MTSLFVLLVVALVGLVALLRADSYGNAFMIEAVGAINTGPLAIATPVSIHLAQAPFTPGPGITLASITEATFDGYAAKTITSFGTITSAPDQTAQCLGLDVLSWTPTGTTTPNTIGGWVAVDHAGNMVSNGAILPTVLMHGTGSNYAMVWGYGVKPGTFTSTILP